MSDDQPANFSSPNKGQFLATNPLRKELVRTQFACQTRKTFLGRLIEVSVDGRSHSCSGLRALNAVGAASHILLVTQTRVSLSSQVVHWLNMGEWACEQCTFLNSADAVCCGVCDLKPPQASADIDKKRKRVKGAEKVLVLDDDESPAKPERTRDEEKSTGTDLLHQLHLERLARQQKEGTSSGGVNGVQSSRERAGSSTFSRPDLEPEPKRPAHARSLSTQAEQASSSQQPNVKRPAHAGVCQSMRAHSKLMRHGPLMRGFCQHRQNKQAVHSNSTRNGPLMPGVYQRRQNKPAIHLMSWSSSATMCGSMSRCSCRGAWPQLVT